MHRKDGWHLIGTILNDDGSTKTFWRWIRHQTQTPPAPVPNMLFIPVEPSLLASLVDKDGET